MYTKSEYIINSQRVSWNWKYQIFLSTEQRLCETDILRPKTVKTVANEENI